jgi:hypothetical protein
MVHNYSNADCYWHYGSSVHLTQLLMKIWCGFTDKVSGNCSVSSTFQLSRFQANSQTNSSITWRSKLSPCTHQCTMHEQYSIKCADYLLECAPWSLTEVPQNLRGMPVKFYQTRWHHIPEDSALHDGLKSNTVLLAQTFHFHILWEFWDSLLPPFMRSSYKAHKST